MVDPRSRRIRQQATTALAWHVGTKGPTDDRRAVTQKEATTERAEKRWGGEGAEKSEARTASADGGADGPQAHQDLQRDADSNKRFAIHPERT